MSALDTSIRIRAGVTGLDDIAELAGQLAETGVNTDELAQSARQLQANWNNLSTEAQVAELAALTDEARRLHELARHRITLGLDVDSHIRAEIERINHAFTELVNSGTLGQDELAQAAERHRQRLGELERELQTAGNSVHQLFNVRSQNTIENEINDVNHALNRLQSELGQGRISQQEFNRLTQAGAQRLDQLQRELAGAQGELNDFGRAAGTAGGQLAGVHKGLNLLSGAMAALGISVGISEIVQLGDEFASLQSRLKLATGDGLAFQSALAGITDIASKTGSDLTATADLFGKLSRATGELGLSQAELLGVTDSISKAMQVSGGSADSMNAALTQLAQGLSAGALRGDELNSVMEQSPRLAQALADGLGVGIGQLRAMGAQGELTAEKVIAAMQSQADVINSEFAKMPTTVGTSIQVLKNNLLTFVGTLSDELNSNNALASFIQGISDKLNSLDPKTVETVKHTFESLGQVASDVLGLAGDIYDTLSALGSAGSEQVGLVTQAVQYLNVALGLLSDGVAGVKIGFDVVFGGILVAVGNIKEAFGSLIGFVNKDLGEQIKQSGQAIITQGKTLLDEAHTGAMAFQSKTSQALQDFGKTNADILNEQAQTARTQFDEMSKSGKASTDELQAAFADYAQKAIAANGGVIDETLKLELAQKGLQAVIDDTGSVTIQAMEGAKSALAGFAAETDKYKDKDSYFKALGLDIDEFATGISSKATTALTAFSEIAKIAEGDTQKIAIAYAATKKQMGDSEQAQNALNASLTEAVGGSQALTKEIQALAAAQGGAKSATDTQAQALKALGVEMAAVNQGMSKSASEMVAHLHTGLVAIKEQAVGANELKTALSAAFDTAIKSAQTANDFKAIGDAITQAGLSASLTSEQMAVLQAGMAGGAKAVKNALDEQTGATDKQKKATGELKDATDSHTKATSENSQAVSDNTKSLEQLSDAKQKTATATERQSQATEQAHSVLTVYDQQMNAMVKTLSQLAGDTDTAKQAIDDYHKSLGLINGAGFAPSLETLNRVNNALADQVVRFNETKQAALDATQALSKTTAGSYELKLAQQALATASSASVNGIIKIDSQTLDRLKAQIDSTKARLDSLAQSAKSTADSLESELARLKGDDVRAIQIENTKKLIELETKLSDARTRNNQDEIAALQKAVGLQQQINEERLKKAQEQATSKQGQTKTKQQDSATNTKGAGDIADSIEALIAKARAEGASELVAQLQKELKRRAR